MKENVFDCKAFGLKHITSIDEVRSFALYLAVDLDLCFHPDDPFESYLIEGTKKRRFSREEAEIANRLMSESFKMFRKPYDIYFFMSDIFLEKISIEKRFSLCAMKGILQCQKPRKGYRYLTEEKVAKMDLKYGFGSVIQNQDLSEQYSIDKANVIDCI